MSKLTIESDIYNDALNTIDSKLNAVEKMQSFLTALGINAKDMTILEAFTFLHKLCDTVENIDIDKITEL